MMTEKAQEGGAKGLTLLLGAIAAAITAAATIPQGLYWASTYLPPRWLWIWGAAPLVLFFLLAWSSWYWLHDHTYRDAWLANRMQAERLKLNHGEGWTPVAWLDPSGLSISKHSEKPKFVVQTKDRGRREDGLTVQALRITEPNGDDTNLEYAVLYDRASWMRGSMTEAEGLDGTGVHIEEAIRHAGIAPTIRRSRRILCFGFASSDRERLTQEENEGLSDDRAINLCIALAKLGYVDFDREQETIAVGFGEALYTAARNGSFERPILVVAILDAPRRSPPQEYVPAIRSTTSLNGFDLSAYSRFSKPPVFKRNPGRQLDYKGRAAAEWQRSTIQAFSDQPLPPLKQD